MKLKRKLCYINNQGYKIYFAGPGPAFEAFKYFAGFLNTKKELQKLIGDPVRHIYRVYQDESLKDCNIEFNTEYHCEWQESLDKMGLFETKTNKLMGYFDFLANINIILKK